MLGAALHGGEDYELILVVDAGNAEALRAVVGLSVIGRITAGGGVRVLDASGQLVDVGGAGYEHFKEG